MDITIKRAEKSDYINIKQACIEEGWTSFLREDCDCALDRSVMLCAYVGEAFAGYLRALTDGYITTFICEILIVKEFRRKGIGRQLLNYIQSLYPKTRIDLISEEDEFYLAQGFHAFGSGMRRRADERF